MLQGDFYSVLNLVKEDASVKVLVGLNPDHRIFNGHFPGTPVVPGVCMMQMVKEIMETIIGNAMMCSSADYMKFLVVIDPRTDKVITIDIVYKIADMNAADVVADLSAGERVCFKFKGRFVSR